MNSRVDEFIIEAREHLTAVEESLLALEALPNSPDAPSWVDRCFRSIHSIKGDAGYLGLKQINQLAHAMESALDGPSPPAVRTCEILLSARDRLAALIDNPQHREEVDLSHILRLLDSATAVAGVPHFEVDLRRWNDEFPGGISAYVLNSVKERNLQHAEIQLSLTDLRQGLPSGPVVWKASAKTASQAVPSETPVVQPNCSEKFSINFSTSPFWNGGIVSAYQEFADSVDSTAGQLNVGAADLRYSLSSDEVVWRTEGYTRLSRDELTKRFGTVFLDLEVGADERPSSDRPALPPQSKADYVGSKPSEVSSSPQPTLQASQSVADKSSTLRIHVELLDRMMNLVGELTLVRNQSLIAFAEEDGAHRAIIQRLNAVTTELQDVTLRSRMQPIGNLFSRFPRMVRDLARQLGKKVEIELQGSEVELDKKIIEQLSDPLMHLVRNSVDHGIELPDDRIKVGKSPVGRIVLSATHEDGQVQIQIHDDGRGINSQSVKAKALSLSLRSAAELDRMSAKELNSLILLPGFSTATTVTEVSGRGVGMDVVKTNIEQLEGSLQLDSQLGQGCSVKLRLPLTLAIIPSVIVKVRGERFAIPQRDVEEVVCLHPASQERIERAFNTEIYRLREKLLPVVRFNEVLDRTQPFTESTKAEILAKSTSDSVRSRIEYILVLKLADRRFGLLVDEVHGTQEIVVKPMHPSMKRVSIFAGATIMGDGRIALIADVEGIFQHSDLSFEQAVSASHKTERVRDAAHVHRVLLFEHGPQERFALPLIQIRRVEMVSPSRIERVGDREFITIDGVATRVLRLDKVMNASAPAEDLPLMSFILPKFVQRPMGILVSHIVDTESLALDLQQDANQDDGILGTAIVHDRLTLFLEMHRLSEKLFGDSNAPSAPGTLTGRSKRLLLIDDTAFFREVVKRYLGEQGYQIVTAVHGEDALNRLAADPGFDLIVSDIEMPVMDGWEFARTVRRQGIKTPMLALSSLSGDEYENKAKECGYDGYEVKLDHDRLLRKVKSMVSSGGLAS